jgi:hypothetical protein
VENVIPRRREDPRARWLLVGVLVAAALLAFGARGLLAARLVQARAMALLKAGKPAEALDEADLRLSHQPDDPHLRNVAVAAAGAHVDLLLEENRDPADVAAWLESQLKRRPYLRPALEQRLKQLRELGGAGEGGAPPTQPGR